MQQRFLMTYKFNMFCRKKQQVKSENYKQRIRFIDAMNYYYYYYLLDFSGMLTASVINNGDVKNS